MGERGAEGRRVAGFMLVCSHIIQTPLEARNKMGPRCRCAVKCTTCFRLEAAVHFTAPVSEASGSYGCAIRDTHAHCQTM